MSAAMDTATFNLSALADRLLAEGRKTDFAMKIRAAVDAHSIKADLTLAGEACTTLAFLADQPQAMPANMKDTAQAALLSYAILLYVRATKSNSEARRTYDLRSKLSAEEKQVHAELCDLRDKAVAHFGTGGSYVGNWTVEVAIADVVGDGVRPAVASRRLVLDRTLLRRARFQISRALEIMGNEHGKRMNVLTDAFEAECRADPVFYKEVEQHPFNLAIFLGGDDQAAQARTGRISGGQTRGRLSHS
jgi:hypothetical protein